MNSQTSNSSRNRFNLTISIPLSPYEKTARKRTAEEAGLDSEEHIRGKMTPKLATKTMGKLFLQQIAIMKKSNSFFGRWMDAPQEQSFIGKLSQLVSYGADVNVLLSEEDGTPLSIAVKMRSEKIVEFLLMAKANPNLAHTDSFPPIYDAARLKHDCIIKLLLQHGATLHAEPGRTSCLNYISDHNDCPHLYELFIESGANIEHKNEDGFTPFLQAIRAGAYSKIKLLLENGANIHESTAAGETWVELNRSINAGYIAHLVARQAEFMERKAIEREQLNLNKIVKFLYLSERSKESPSNSHKKEVMEDFLDEILDPELIFIEHGLSCLNYFGDIDE